VEGFSTVEMNVRSMPCRRGPGGHSKYSSHGLRKHLCHPAGGSVISQHTGYGHRIRVSSSLLAAQRCGASRDGQERVRVGGSRSTLCFSICPG